MMNDVSNCENTANSNVSCHDDNTSQKYKSLVRYLLLKLSAFLVLVKCYFLVL